MATCDAMFSFLNEAFMAFCEVLTNEGSSYEACKKKLHELHVECNQKGLSGANALSIITQYQAQIKWQNMSPDQFSRFYRFVFYICRDHGKRNIQMSVAVAAWHHILLGRFRLLERWCTFAAASSALVVTQDLWRQVLDFSRSVHEDLSNYDTAGSWAVLLDEFVEEMRTSRQRTYTTINISGNVVGGGGGSSDRLNRRVSSGADLGALFTGGGGGAAGHCSSGATGGHGDDDDGMGFSSFVASISPRCGSKRRGPDVDVVAEQLSAMPLGADQQNHHHQHSLATGMQGPHRGAVVHGALPPVRQCGHGGYGQGVAQPHGAGGGGFQRGGVAEALVKRQCLDRQVHLQPPYPAQQQHPMALLQPFPLSRAESLGVAASCAGSGGGGDCTVGLCGGGAGAGGRTPSSGHPMSCSTGSWDSDGSQGGPTGSAAMDCWLQDHAGTAAQEPALLLQQQHHHHHLCPTQHYQQRKAIRARRSGLSDIVKSAVSDALGF